jgi:hypothetical protein
MTQKSAVYIQYMAHKLSIKSQFLDTLMSKCLLSPSFWTQVNTIDECWHSRINEWRVSDGSCD